MPTLSIEGMEFYAYHGCFKEEQIIGTRFLVDLHIETDTSSAEASDDLKKTLNYQDVYGLVREEMEQRSNLIEHVARRILDRLMKEKPEIASAQVKVSKINPPVGGKVDRVSISLQLSRD